MIGLTGIDALEAEMRDRLSAANSEIERLRAHLTKSARQCDLLASAMRDPKRTGGWPGAEKVAQAFDRQAFYARKALTLSRPVEVPLGIHDTDTCEACGQTIPPF